MAVSLITDMKAGPLGIENNRVEAFTIYPEPSSGLFNIQGGDADIAVINIHGQVVHKTSVAGNASLDLSQLDKGIYYVRLLHKDGVTIRKVP